MTELELDLAWYPSVERCLYYSLKVGRFLVGFLGFIIGVAVSVVLFLPVLILGCCLWATCANVDDAYNIGVILIAAPSLACTAAGEYLGNGLGIFIALLCFPFIALYQGLKYLRHCTCYTQACGINAPEPVQKAAGEPVQKAAGEPLATLAKSVATQNDSSYLPNEHGGLPQDGELIINSQVYVRGREQLLVVNDHLPPADNSTKPAITG